MGCQKRSPPHAQVTPHRSPEPPLSGYSWLNRFPDLGRVGSSAASTQQGGYLPPGTSLRQLAGWRRSFLLVRQTGVWARLHLLSRRAFYSRRQVPPPHLLSVGLERRGHDPLGLKFKLLVKKELEWREKTPIQSPIFLLCLLNAGSAEMRENNIPLSTDRPTFCHFTFVSDRDAPTGLSGITEDCFFSSRLPRSCSAFLKMTFRNISKGTLNC